MFRRVAATSSLVWASPVLASTSQIRCVGHDQFLNAASLQKIYAETRDKTILGDAKKFFETQSLEGVEKLGDDISEVMNAIVAFRPSIPATQSVRSIMDYMQTDASLENVSVEAASRVLHAGVVLHIPQIFDVLMFWLWKIVADADKLSQTGVATTLNAYGRAGVKHDILYKSLMKRGLVLMSDQAPPVTHIANILHALSRVRVYEEKFFTMLANHAVQRKSEAIPLVVATILDACAVSEFYPTELFAEYETLVLSKLQDYSPALLASVALSVAQAGVSTKTDNTTLYSAIAERGMVVTSTYDANTIAKTMKAFSLAKFRHEDFFGCMAERACKLVQDFHLSEIRDVLQSLAQFDLYDGELFPLMATKVAQTRRTALSFPIAELAEIVRSFAQVNERNDEFLKSIVPALRASLRSIKDAPLVDLLFSFATFGIRTEIVQSFLYQRHRLSEASKVKYMDDLAFVEKQFPGVAHKEPETVGGANVPRQRPAAAPVAPVTPAPKNTAPKADEEIEEL